MEKYILNSAKELVNFIIKFLNKIKRKLDLRLNNLKWNKYFRNNNETIYELNNSSKIKLMKNSKLTEFVLFHDFEQTELSFFQNYLAQGDIVLDIGANIGLHAVYAGECVGETGKVYAFEPVKQTFSRLQENINLNESNIEPVNQGFSNTEDTLTINTSDYYDAWNTLANKHQLGNHKNMFSGTEQIKVQPLDVWLKNNKIIFKNISLIKIDVEGWEKFVLEGAKNFLSHKEAPVLMIEFDEINTWACGYLCHELYDILVELGFKIFTYNSITNTLILEDKKMHYPSQNLFAIKPGNTFSERLSIEEN